MLRSPGAVLPLPPSKVHHLALPGGRLWWSCELDRFTVLDRIFEIEVPEARHRRERRLWFPLDMAETRAGRNGYASQRRCLSCMADLSGAEPCWVDPDRSGLLSPLEAHWLRAGCELVNALCRPLSDGDLPAEVRRSYELDSLPSTGQWKQLELRLRDPGNPEARGALAAPLTYSRLRRSWAGLVFNFHPQPQASVARRARRRCPHDAAASDQPDAADQ